jgi:CRISPR-associated protein Cmr2
MMDLEKFIRAIAYCLQQDGHTGDLVGLARWALTPGTDEHPPGDSSLQVALVSGGATKIKGYVFESARLPEIRGASALLDRVNIQDVPQLWKMLPSDGVDCSDCIIYANGGEILAFTPINHAAWLADEIERIYTQETLVAQSVAIWMPFSLQQIRNGLLAGIEIDPKIAKQLMGHNPADNATFGSLVAPLALAKYRRREENPSSDRPIRAIAHFETFPFARRCSSCERRAAIVNARVGSDDKPLCEPCARKRIFGQLTKRKDAASTWWDDQGFAWKPESNVVPAKSWATRFEEWLIKNPLLKQRYADEQAGEVIKEWDFLKVANDLEEIGQASNPKGFIGVVYADGNNMGQLLETLQTPMEYADFAEAVYKANQDAVFESLANNLKTFTIERKDKNKVLAHPFEILSIGGDDVFLVVPADAALKIACDIAEKVEAKLTGPLFNYDQSYVWDSAQRCKGVPPSLQCRVSLSVGVVLADAHVPIFYLEDLAGQLLKSAKRRAKYLKQKKNYYGGTIDFVALKSVSMISGSIEDFRKKALTKPGLRLFARPYTISEMRTLILSIKDLKDCGFPKSQLYRFRNSLGSSHLQATVDYLYFMSRSAETMQARKAIEVLWPSPKLDPPSHPWLPQLEDPNQLETIWHDLAEIYDFVHT